MGYRMENGYTRFLVSFLTFVVMSIPFIFFAIYHVRYCIDNGMSGLSVLGIVLGVVTFLAFIITSRSNPGVINKQVYPARVYDELKGKYRTTNPPRLIDTTINGQVLKVKYCITCHIYRPPRTVHCSDCDVCVIRYDHHCPYIANCVGYHNYKRFLVFVLLCSLYYTTLTVVSVIRSIEFFQQFSDAIADKPVEIIGTLVSAIITFMSLWVILGLFIFHMFLISKNTSTYDKFKENYVDFNPFNRGFLTNCWNVLLYWQRKNRGITSVYQPNAMYKMHERLSQDIVTPKKA
ncbi:zinc finger protein DHHC domain containing protein [Theileria equi strain WA]|uniref:Palmitoyltransferase n=1 Tax=Theileria equi strain WA TaxID=1537102 RepID=L1LDM4_THEEQ|nr:zinc finger protein DHHC domain containing protein [Theileria equi strain WA]EKX73345.1 zinc finger protein DHHC domain containing protein [Theileria equi strain WA]|eukprot:XP_004832797.1 zinc finger protein DHHC domain containing protein [Theileria equi strain WA]